MNALARFTGFVSALRTLTGQCIHRYSRIVPRCSALALVLFISLFSSVGHADTNPWVVFRGSLATGGPTWTGEESTWEDAAQDVLELSQSCFGAPNCIPLVIQSCYPSGVPTSGLGGCTVTSPAIPGGWGFGLNLAAHQAPPNYFAAAQPRARSATCSKPCVGDPINPSLGNVYKTDTDVPSGVTRPISFERFYNSQDVTGTDMGPGWRHSYGRSIIVSHDTSSPLGYTGQSALVSAEYPDPATACTQGFADIQPAVSAWATASASYIDNTCVLSSNGQSIGSLVINSSSVNAPIGPVTEYDVVRDDGRILRYTTQGGAINNPPGTSLRLSVTSSGFTVVDDQDTVEVYNAAGVLQSISSRTGIVQTLAYDANGRLSAVTDSFGNSLSITRNAANQIATIALNGSASIQYGYNSVLELSTVKNADSTTRQFVYGTLLSSQLTSEVDENNSAYATWGYDSQHRATSSSLAGGVDSVSLVYNSDDTVTVTNAIGAVRTFSFTRTGDLKPVNGVSGAPCVECGDSLATTYDLAGWVSSRTDYNGNLTCYSNDAARGLELVRVEGFAPGSTCPTNLVAYTPGSGTRQRRISTTWDSTFREPTNVTEANRTTTFVYYPTGDLHTKTITDTTVTPNVSRTWTYTYNSYGRVLTADGPRADVADVTTYSYYTCTTGYQCGQVQTVTNAAGQTTTYNTYNAYGQPLTITDPNGILTTLTYDARQRLTSRQTASETTAFDYWPTGLLKKVTLPDGSYLAYTYDGAHRLTQVTDALGNKTVYTLDAMGNRTAENSYDPANALHRAHSRVFNTLNELWKDVNAAGTAAVTTTFGYDPQGNQTSIAAPLARNTANGYDELNRLKQITDPASGLTQFGYDANDNLTSVTDPRGLATGYSYSGFGDLASQSSPDTGTTANTYDSAGNLITSTDARSAVSTYTYDTLNRVNSVAYSQGGTTDQTITFTYDTGTNGKGHLTGASDANHSLSWSYDALSRVTGKSQTVGSVTTSVGYAYTNGDLTTLTTPSGQTVTYGYNGNHQVTSVAVNGATVLNSVTYEPMGPLSGWTWGNGTTTTRTYDSDGKISQIVSAGTKTYSYDDAFRITGLTDTSPGAANWTYGYDPLDRLTSGTSPSVTRGWTYDANGNRLTESGTAPSNYSISPTNNRIAGITGALARTYAYDAAGNTTGYSTVTATYNNAGRLKTLTNGGSTETSVYNALGQRIRISGGTSGTVLYTYDEAGHLLGEYDGTGTLIEETVWLGEIPVATLKPSGSSVALFYIHSDGLNTPRQVTRPSDHTAMWTWNSDPFGTDAANPNPAGAGTFAYNLRFPGQLFDGQGGLHANGFRDYDPAIARYAQGDPIGLNGGSFSTYAYANANPTGNVDPTGMFVAPVPLPVAAPLAAPIAVIAGAGLVGYGIGTAISNTFTVPIQDAIEKVFPYPTNDPGLQQEIEREANRQEYKSRCNEPPPPGLDPCELAKWNLKKAQDCKALRNANTARWWGGTDTQHDPQLQRDLDNAIKNAELAVARTCRCR